MPYGWTQLQKNWVVVRSNNDTTITYNFLKQDLMNLRVYVVKLEGTAALYEETQKIVTLQDSTINTLNKLILNKDYMLNVADSTVKELDKELLRAEAWGKQQEKMKIKYQKRAKNWPKWFGAGGVIGFVACLMLVK